MEGNDLCCEHTTNNTHKGRKIPQNINLLNVILIPTTRFYEYFRKVPFSLLKIQTDQQMKHDSVLLAVHKKLSL